jgi:hypothetical protein
VDAIITGMVDMAVEDTEDMALGDAAEIAVVISHA